MPLTSPTCRTIIYNLNIKLAEGHRKLDNSKLGSTQQQKIHMLTLTCCQDHILIENIWFVWSGHVVEMRGGGTDAGQTTNIEDRATQAMEVGG